MAGKISQLFSVNDKAIIVTGSNQGNGLAIAEGLISAGATVIRIDKSFKQQIGAFDLVCDITDFKSVDKNLKTIKEEFKQIDGLINNAGISISSKSPYDDFVKFSETLNLNLYSTFYLTSKIFPLLNIKGSSIINITSLGAELGFPNNPSYQISKAGLRQMSKAMAKDFSIKNVRVNNICPGYIKTKMTEKSFNNKQLNEERTNRMIIKRWGIPSDLVGPVIFLLSDASQYITGSDVYVDGGWTANGL